IESVWPSPDQPPTVRQSLANLVARLRAAYGAEFIESTGAGYRLGRHVMSDRARFVAGVERASAVLVSAPGDALDEIDRALKRVRGRPWHDVDSPIEVEADRARLEDAIRSARRIRALALAKLGSYDESIVDLEVVLADDPTDEIAWLELATCLAKKGARVDALRTLTQARRQLAEHGLTVSARAAELERQLLAGSPTAQNTSARLPTTPTPLIGRSALLAELNGQLAQGSMITLLGPAGIGKTRLAVELARSAAIDSVYFVDLSAVFDDNLVSSALVAALGVTVEPGTAPTDALVEHIGHDHVLLVLDNCEQVVGGVADLIETIAASCPSCSSIATSRQRLAVSTERVVRVEPLTAGLNGSGVELFFDRANRLGVDLPRDDWGESAAGLCAALDGLPLAIELAAARTTVLSPSEILAALTDRFRVLRDVEGAGLEDAIRWSWDLLDDTERTALHHLAVFQSGATIDAAASVWVLDEWQTIELAEQLAHKSLIEIRRSPVAPTRLEMLDSIRHFVLDDAAQSATLAGCRDRHLAWVDQFTSEALGAQGFTCDAQGMKATDRERHEISAALDHSASNDEHFATGAMVCHRLFPWWRARGATQEGFHRLEPLVPRAQLGRDDQAAISATLASLARIAAIPDEHTQSLGLEAERQLCEISPSRYRNNIELRLLEATFDDRDPGLGIRLRRLADSWRVGEDPTALHLLAAWSITNTPEEARAVAEEFLACAESSAESWREPLDGHPREFQGLAEIVAGSIPEGARYLSAAIKLHLAHNKTFCAIHCAEGVAWLAIEAGDTETGQSLLAATEGLRQTRHRSRSGFEQQAITGALRHLPRLPEPTLDADIDQTIKRALQIADRFESGATASR
ncbi:MAG: BTAD domain-containing putative transcriptional regulator, partial [Actinomycetota bacterium]